MKIFFAALCCSIMLYCNLAFSQLPASKNHADTITSSYNPADLFAPMFYKQRGTDYRAANGNPGPKYWQNRADYNLNVVLDTLANTITGSETITYTNNSPDNLNYLWLQLDQNIYKANARSNYFTSFAPINHTYGYQIVTVSITKDNKTEKANYIVNDTRMQVRLPKFVAANGGKISIDISYKYVVPGNFGNRTDYTSTKNGKIYEIAQWYPRMCVYDDSQGWDTLPFLGAGEFYLEYGDFDYKITLPANMIVAGSGELVNPQEVLTSNQQNLLNGARNSDNTVMVQSLADVLSANKNPAKGLKTWHFKMFNTRDVAFGASAAYIWDAARVNLPGGKKSLAMSVYPAESAGDAAWGRATEYLKSSIEYFSKKWFIYPYPVAINEAGIAGGMEYPGIVFDAITDKGKDLYWVTAHEIGHNWFPMIVGSDERRYGWMDEGFNTFIDIYAADNFNHGEYGPKRDGEYAPGGGYPADEIVPTIADPNAPVIMTIPDATSEKYRHPITYFKPALGLVLLREQILGTDRFDYAFKNYINNWAYKHPQPDDFFRSMENAAGEDLSWFWRGWFYNNYKYDIALIDARYTDKSTKQGLILTIANKEQLALPVRILINYKDGSRQYTRLPVATWLQNKVAVITIPTSREVNDVVLDPDHILPDADRSNNLVKMK